MLAAVLMTLVLAAQPETPAVAGPLQASNIQRPYWVRKPYPAAVRAAHPKAAVAAGVTGRAVISCGVTVEGRLSNCMVVSETPEGMGFGEAALGLAAQYRMKPPEGGADLTGANVWVPVSFSNPPMSLNEVITCYQALSTGVLGQSNGLGIMRYRDISKRLLEPKAREAGVSPADLKTRLAEVMKRPPNDGGFPVRCGDLDYE